MISRVAESCFWLNRYVERVENTARLLRVHRSFILDLGLPNMERWRPVIVVSGEKERYAELCGADAFDDGEKVQEYLTWDEKCPVSIVSSMHWARENARMMREIISVDMWEALNDFWYWLRRGSGRRLFRQHRDEFYHRVRDWPHEFYGLAHASLMHDEPFDFMRLGMLLERGEQTARLLDVKHHLLGGATSKSNTAIENASWLLLLHTCSAVEPFYKKYQEAVSAHNVAAFLVMETDFPRSIAHCVDRSWNFMKRIRSGTTNGEGAESASLLRDLFDTLSNTSIDTMLDEGLHDHLTSIVNRLADVCTAVHSDFFALHLPPREL